MNPVQKTVFVGLAIATIQVAFANPEFEAEQKMRSFLWSAPASSDAETTLIYNDVTTAYNTKITFTRDNEFRRSDGVRGMWHFEDGKLVLKGLDTEGFTIVFHPDSATYHQIRGRITEGKWRNNKILLKLPTSSKEKDTTQD